MTAAARQRERDTLVHAELQRARRRQVDIAADQLVLALPTAPPRGQDRRCDEMSGHHAV